MALYYVDLAKLHASKNSLPCIVLFRVDNKRDLHEIWKATFVFGRCMWDQVLLQLMHDVSDLLPHVDDMEQ
jgi:hypothetical protein